jgi:hypothetical protein
MTMAADGSRFGFLGNLRIGIALQTVPETERATLRDHR